MVSSTFCGFYGYTCYDARSWDNEILRMGMAGSLANIICDTSFHLVDTVNIRSKAVQSGKSESMYGLMRRIYMKEGIYGFGKGFSACFYGAAAAGFMYFSLYKWLKTVFKDNLVSETFDMALCYMLASLTAESITLLVQYPYDLVKCRLQSVNYYFRYQNLPHAFRKEIKTNGVGSLYQGATPFLITYCAFISLQFTIYESMMSHFKRSMTKEKFADQELSVNCLSGFVAGVVAAAATNALEAVTVAK